MVQERPFERAVSCDAVAVASLHEVSGKDARQFVKWTWRPAARPGA